MFDNLKSVAGPFFDPSMFICFSFLFRTKGRMKEEGKIK